MISFLFPSGSGGKKSLIIGGLFILFGIVIASNPEILVFLISSLFIFIGLIIFSVGLRSYQSGKKKHHSGYIDLDDRK